MSEQKLRKRHAERNVSHWGSQEGQVNRVDVVANQPALLSRAIAQPCGGHPLFSWVAFPSWGPAGISFLFLLGKPNFSASPGFSETHLHNWDSRLTGTGCRKRYRTQGRRPDQRGLVQAVCWMLWDSWVSLSSRQIGMEVRNQTKRHCPWQSVTNALWMSWAFRGGSGWGSFHECDAISTGAEKKKGNILSDVEPGVSMGKGNKGGKVQGILRREGRVP